MTHSNAIFSEVELLSVSCTRNLPKQKRNYLIVFGTVTTNQVALRLQVIRKG